MPTIKNAARNSAPFCMPTENDIRLVRETFDNAVPLFHEAADLFWERLSHREPGLRFSFRQHARDPKRNPMVMLAAAVRNLHELDALIPQVKALGARFSDYGIVADHYRIAGEVLNRTLKQGLKGAFTPEVERAWSRVYSLLAAIMRAGAEDARTKLAA